MIKWFNPLQKKLAMGSSPGMTKLLFPIISCKDEERTSYKERRMRKERRGVEESAALVREVTLLDSEKRPVIWTED